jgi:hypothetical protein
LYPQGTAVDTVTRKTVTVTRDSTSVDWGRRYSPVDSIFNETAFHKLHPHQDTSKAIPDTTSESHAGSGRLIGGIVLVSFILVYVILAMGLKDLKNPVK